MRYASVKSHKNVYSFNLPVPRSKRDPEVQKAFYAQHAELCRKCSERSRVGLHLTPEGKRLVALAREAFGYASSSSSTDVISWIMNGWKQYRPT